MDKEKLSYLDAQLLLGVFTNNKEYLKTPNLFIHDTKNVDKSVSESVFKKKRNKRSKKEILYKEEANHLEERTKIDSKVKDKIVTTSKNQTKQKGFANYQVNSPRKLLKGQGIVETRVD
jgi:hypothetical protein